MVYSVISSGMSAFFHESRAGDLRYRQGCDIVEALAPGFVILEQVIHAGKDVLDKDLPFLQFLPDPVADRTALFTA